MQEPAARRDCENGFCDVEDTFAAADKTGPEPDAISDAGNPLIETPAAYDAIRQQMAADDVLIVRYGAPWCRSCRTIGPTLQAYAAERWPNASFDLHSKALLKY